MSLKFWLVSAWTFLWKGFLFKKKLISVWEFPWNLPTYIFHSSSSSRTCRLLCRYVTMFKYYFLHNSPMKSYSEVFINRLFCCLIVGIQARGISIPLSLLMLLGWSLIWIAPLTLGVYQWGSRSINLTLLQIGICPVSLACSATAEVWVRANRMSSSCSFILSRIDLPVLPIYTLPHFHGIL